MKSVKLITERFSGRGKVFYFIEMMSEVEAHSAIDSLNGTNYEGRSMKVNEARALRKVCSGGRNRR